VNDSTLNNPISSFFLWFYPLAWCLVSCFVACLRSPTLAKSFCSRFSTQSDVGELDRDGEGLGGLVIRSRVRHHLCHGQGEPSQLAARRKFGISERFPEFSEWSNLFCEVVDRLTLRSPFNDIRFKTNSG
jgi:hypothetical protein